VHYRITAKLGECGIGAVYRATDTKLNRDVALKMLPEGFAGDRDRMARFQNEGQSFEYLLDLRSGEVLRNSRAHNHDVEFFRRTATPGGVS
jgi:serine/threonine protein kinase